MGIRGSSTKLAGAIQYFAGATAPAGWLKANGALVSRVTYAGLFAAIGTVYGAGDGSTTFALPDLRGEFVRGLDDARGVDTGRTLGSAQSQDIQAHTHTGSNNFGGTFIYGNSVGGSAAPNGPTGSTGGTETRPRNVALLACIKT